LGDTISAVRISSTGQQSELRRAARREQDTQARAQKKPVQMFVGDGDRWLVLVLVALALAANVVLPFEGCGATTQSLMGHPPW
jgi:hypothetical protein